MKVKFYGKLAELFGRELEVKFSGELRGLLKLLERRSKRKLDKLLENFSILVNGKAAEPSTVVGDRDSIVFLPVMIGG